jgi:hypothetical protein
MLLKNRAGANPDKTGAHHIVFRIFSSFSFPLGFIGMLSTPATLLLPNPGSTQNLMAFTHKR